MSKDVSKKTKPSEIDELKTRVAEYLAGWQRERAAFHNYQKEEATRIEVSRIHWQARWLRDILPIIDSFRRASKQVPQDFSTHDWVKGILLIEAQFEKFLSDQGVKRIEALNQVFDPTLHEAVAQVQDKSRAGKVVEVVQEGYAIGDYVVRPARVKVAQ